MVLYHHMIAYTRFKLSTKGILWTKLDSNFSPAIINFFTDKYPLFYIMLEKDGRTFVKQKNKNLIIINKKIKQVVKDYEKILPELEFLKGLEGEGQEIWNNFYDSQYIKQRKNHKLFHHFIPKYLKNVKGLNKEFNSLLENTKITSFIKKIIN